MSYPFEIHITVDTDQIEKFKTVCSNINVKPIVIDLQDAQGDHVMRDVMTSSKHVGDDGTVLKALGALQTALTEQGFAPVRSKVETVPWHPRAPCEANGMPMPKDCYFECHFAVLTTEARMADLSVLAKQTDSHRSRNVFKKMEDCQVVMMTHRAYSGTYESFQQKISDIRTLLEYNGFQMDKIIIEFSIYDTKVSHDKEWIAA